MNLYPLLKYFAMVIATEKSFNIWLATLPDSLQDSAYEVGKFIVEALAALGG